MALHEELNSMLRQGQRECLQLNRLIRKLKSSQAMLMMKRDKAKKELEVYVNKLSESLIYFRSEMYVSIQTELEQKVKEITSLQDKYETSIDSYMELCDETEKLVQFGKSINNEKDRYKAQQLLEDFSRLHKLTSDCCEIDAIMKLEFYPALPLDCISSSMFGDLIRGTPSKLHKSGLSALSARKSRFSIDQNYDKVGDHAEAVEKLNQCTQTDFVEEQDSRKSSNEAETQTRNLESVGYSLMQCDQQQCMSYQQTTPPGFEYVTMPFCRYDTHSSQKPPPGFPVYQHTESVQSIPLAGVPQQNIQMNTCLLTDVPVYHPGRTCNPLYTALPAPNVNYQVQNTPLYQCNRSVSPDPSCFYQTQQHCSSAPTVRKSHAIPITSPDVQTEKNRSHHINGKNIKNDSVAQNVRLSQSNFKDIPLPIGPAPKANVIHIQNKDEQENLKQTTPACKKTGFRMSDKGNDNTVGEWKKNIGSIKEDDAEQIKTNTLPITKLKSENEEYYEGKNQCSDGIQRFEMLQKRTAEMLKAYSIDDINGPQRTDESEDTDNERRNFSPVQKENHDKMIANSEKITCTETEDIINVEIDHMLSNIHHQIKDKVAKGEEVITPIKPLRRPLRLPRNYQADLKIKTEIETVSCNDSVSSMDSGFIEKGCVINNKTEKESEMNCGLNKMSMSEIIKEELNEEHVISNIKEVNKEMHEELVKPDILDLSSSTGVNLRDLVKSEGPSNKEVRKLNKETLQSQTKWLKGYLKQVLPNNKQEDSSLKVCDENNNATEKDLITETTQSKRIKINHVSAKIDVKTASDANFEINSNKGSASDSLTDLLNQSENEVEEPKSNLENIGITFVPQKENVTADRKADLKNLKSAVKGYLGDQKKVNQRCAATYSRLGALQAHWLKHSSGTDIQASFLFKCSHDMHFPIGVSTNSLQQIIVADTGNHCVKMFDQSGKFIRVFGGESMRRPSAIAINEFDHIFVKDDLSIKVFDNLGDYIMDIDTKFSKPFGLVLTPAKCLLVLETDRRHPALVHVTQDGCRFWRFPYSPLLNAPVGSKCRFMALSENNVFVSDLGLSKIYITNLEGVFFKVIGSCGDSPMQFHEPSGISVDNFGNIVIGDSKNNRIQVFRHDGSFTGLINFDDKIVRPSDVHLTSDNKLIVVNFLHHNIKVYQLTA